MARVGIINLTSEDMGGIFNYEICLIEGLKEHGKHEYFVFTKERNSKKFCSSSNCKPICVPKSILSSESAIIRTFSLFFGIETQIDRIVKKYKLDLIISPSVTLNGFYLGAPYIVTIHDMMHKYYHNFSEYPFHRRIMRDIIYKRSAENSIFAVVDSNGGKKDLINFYNIDEHKIKIIPYCPSLLVSNYKNLDESAIKDVIRKYNLPDKFIFYPAQFWEHKNHLRLIKAIDFLKNNFRETIPLVLVGSKREAYPKIIRLIDKLNLKSDVTHIGFVSQSELVALYKASKMLVYPSLIGHTNIPPLEAMMLGTPVVCSNIFSMPEQVGDAGLLFDPFNIEDIADKIYKVWTNEPLRSELSKLGYERAKNFTLEKFAVEWEEIIEEALDKNSYTQQ